MRFKKCGAIREGGGGWRYGKGWEGCKLVTILGMLLHLHVCASNNIICVTGGPRGLWPTDCPWIGGGVMTNQKPLQSSNSKLVKSQKHLGYFVR